MIGCLLVKVLFIILELKVGVSIRFFCYMGKREGILYEER